MRHRLAGAWVHWEGVALSATARPGRRAGRGKALRFESFDGLYTESLTLDQARRPDVIAAYSMLGGPVTGPTAARCASTWRPCTATSRCKWLSRIQVVDQVEPGYWEKVGNYDVEGWVGEQQWPQRPVHLTTPPATTRSCAFRPGRAGAALGSTPPSSLILMLTGAALYLGRSAP